MDKSSKISIKINGEEKAFEEGAVTSQDQKEENNGEFGWVLPTPDGLGKKVIVLDDVKKKKKINPEQKVKEKKKITFFTKKSPSKSIIISIIGASLIGLCFGFVFLGIFKQSKPDALNPTKNSVSVSGTATNQVQMKIPAVKFDLAQVGMYKSMESAKKNEKEVSSNGLTPVIYEKNNNFFVVIALSGKDSTFLADEVKKKLKSTYLKEETIGGQVYKGPKQSVDMYKAEVETFNFMLSYLTDQNFNNEKQLEQISSTMLILSKQKDYIKNKQLLNGLKHLQNIEKVMSSSNKQNHLNKVTQSVQYDMLSLFKILKEQKNTLTN
ncbi:hypothetical protein [Bacillus sp. AFS088145]|uniref:hypothetical protein n=1 Tax=Bacillus sp. AFS088145 TaxID=2033514 RepID=UPI000BF9364D|nr:hypothetical protein [Bacillus sp. AFS088145]PFH90242.1 hypothetical protein COI44_04590 [Bacillus sp. AFS088145]